MKFYHVIFGLFFFFCKGLMFPLVHYKSETVFKISSEVKQNKLIRSTIISRSSFTFHFMNLLIVNYAICAWQSVSFSGIRSFLTLDRDIRSRCNGVYRIHSACKSFMRGNTVFSWLLLLPFPILFDAILAPRSSYFNH